MCHQLCQSYADAVTSFPLVYLQEFKSNDGCILISYKKRRSIFYAVTLGHIVFGVYSTDLTPCE
jgi:hypothetical protein